MVRMNENRKGKVKSIFIHGRQRGQNSPVHLSRNFATLGPFPRLQPPCLTGMDCGAATVTFITITKGKGNICCRQLFIFYFTLMPFYFTSLIKWHGIFFILLSTIMITSLIYIRCEVIV